MKHTILIALTASLLNVASAGAKSVAPVQVGGFNPLHHGTTLSRSTDNSGKNWGAATLLQAQDDAPGSYWRPVVEESGAVSTFEFGGAPGWFVLKMERALVDPALLGLEADDVTVASVPEPASLTLFGMGLVGLGAALRRRRTA